MAENARVLLEPSLTSCIWSMHLQPHMEIHIGLLWGKQIPVHMNFFIECATGLAKMLRGGFAGLEYIWLPSMDKGSVHLQLSK